MSEVVLISPPFTQLNTPYPATAYLKGFLNTKNVSSTQFDLGLEVILKVFSNEGLKKVFDISPDEKVSENAFRIYALKSEYIQTIDSVVSFLQRKNDSLAVRIAERNYLPEASRFNYLEDLDWAFGSMGVIEKAKHIATLYLEDISDYLVEVVDANFGFSRYAEQMGRSAREFDALDKALNSTNTFFDNILREVLDKRILTLNPKLVAVSVPFPGNLYSAFKIAQHIKKIKPQIKIALGGGFPNTELRSLSEPKVFNYFDFVTLDDGELPLLNILKYLKDECTKDNLKRSFILNDKKVIYVNNTTEKDFPQRELGTPDYSDLKLDQYLSVIEIINPMHRLWSDGRWNKLTLAHGCYWGKCTFCDISLDYIGRYEPLTAQLICDRIEEMIQQTGETGFHFVDEAAPPSLMKELALEILRRKLNIVWWTNIRFEKSFHLDLCKLLSASGCIAVSGGLEVASDRLLKLIDKGVSIEQVARVVANFTEAGIMVHSYLMYGYPSQTIQETIDSLEVVRQLFENGIVQSGFWHRFALTAHSPVGLNPEKFGIQIIDERLGRFANNDLEFIDKTGVDHERFSEGLRKSLFNYMHGLCFDFSLDEWFDFKTPKTKIKSELISDIINKEEFISPKPSSKIIWLYNLPMKKEVSNAMTEMHFHIIKGEFIIKLKHEISDWLFEWLNKLMITNEKPVSYQEIDNSYQESFNQPFSMFLYSKEGQLLRENGFLIL